MPVNELYNEKQVLQLLAQGSEYAFAQLFDQYRNRVYGVAFRFLKLPELAEEVVQDVFLKIWLKREDMPAVNNPQSYIFMMARNTVMDRFKKQATETAFKKMLSEEEGFADDADYLLRNREYTQLIQQAVNDLPPQQKQVYLLARTEGLSQEEIAERMGLSRMTVKKHMAKALQGIRQYLQNYTHITFVALFIKILESVKVL